MRVRAFAILFLLCAACAPASAQSFWSRAFGAPAHPPAPCALDSCVAQTPAAQPMRGAAPPGAFDFYLLTLSWSPGFCDTGGATKSPDQCSIGSSLGFVVHGLWPQYDSGYPSDCNPNAPQPSIIALQQTQGLFPNTSLARYEWRKHGTCTGLSPQAYFADVKRARDAIVIPDALKAPREEVRTAPMEIARAFVAANPGLRIDNMAVGCLHGELQDVKICISKDIRAFANCDEVVRSTCRAQSIAIAPLH